MLFGDGAGAAVVTLSPHHPYASLLGSDGAQSCIWAQGPGPHPSHLQMDGKAVFRFEDVPVKPGDNTVVVRAGGLEERAVIEGVETEPEEYRLPEGAGSFVHNWFASGTDEIDPTRFSTEDKVRDLVANPEVQALIKKFVGNKVPRFLISLVKPFRVKTLLKLPFVKLDEQMISMVDRYLQTIKK